VKVEEHSLLVALYDCYTWVGPNDVSVEVSASIFRVSTMETETVCSSETKVTMYQTAWRHSNIHSHRHLSQNTELDIRLPTPF
jgi:hypothetical protein